MENRRQDSFDFSSPGALTPTYWDVGKPHGITSIHPMKAQKANMNDVQESVTVEVDVEKKAAAVEEKSASRYGRFLEPPKPHRLMLISPPSSPPVGWEPILEDGPVINYELIAALARMASSDEPEVELYPGSDDIPKLVVKCI